MKQAIKKIIEVILTIIACVSFILMFGERVDGSFSLAWNGGWMAALAISSWLLGKMGVFDRESI